MFIDKLLVQLQSLSRIDVPCFATGALTFNLLASVVFAFTTSAEHAQHALPVPCSLIIICTFPHLVSTMYFSLNFFQYDKHSTVLIERYISLFLDI